MTITRKDYETVRRLYRDNGLAHTLKWEPVVGAIFAKLKAQPEDPLAWRVRYQRAGELPKHYIPMTTPDVVFINWMALQQVRRRQAEGA